MARKASSPRPELQAFGSLPKKSGMAEAHLWEPIAQRGKSYLDAMLPSRRNAAAAMLPFPLEGYPECCGAEATSSHHGFGGEAVAKAGGSIARGKGAGAPLCSASR